ncbi:MAG: hypothetical protein F6K54_26285 [Okeania sp. SIO3B5]|uniref:hypothetical protein n=1 Tax=Okeania sp. SIO3B5 TaxID=2607811 RepID=UPI001400C96B|nr:hypothetical protein [Okeania sp. SIO3B5]NEO56283.1 hypothetical protein [Okeania sp. SIO3B5]
MRLTHLTHDHPPASVANVIAASTENLISNLNEHGRLEIRIDRPVNEDKIIELMGTENLMSYKYGN